MKRILRPLSGQCGQALAEAAVMLGVLCSLLWAVRATGIWQDEALRAGLAARQAAFAYSRFAPDPGEDIDAQVDIVLATQLSEEAQPGGVHPNAGVLRRQWALGEAEVAAVRVVVPLSHAQQAGAALTLKRYTAVLRGAGHAGGDAQTQQRVASSALGWQAVARGSSSAGQAVATRMNPLDAAWGRVQPGFDWLNDWTAAVPSAFLRAEGGQP